MSECGHNTNLAAEFYVLSMLYRLGTNAHLTLGNKKSVDIVVERNGQILTIDVKGLRDKSCFPIDNWTRKDKNHYLILVSFLKKIDDCSTPPEIYIVPSLEIEKKHKILDDRSIVYVNPKGNRTVIEYNRLKKLGSKYRDKWNYLL